jgi:hypothetical protein
MNILDWVINNWENITGIFAQVINIGAYVIAAASVLVNLTPSTKDNVILDKIKVILSLLALNFTFKKDTTPTE